MPRHFWVSASIAMLVAAFALFAFALPRLYLLDGATSSARDQGAQQVSTYPVPPARADAILNSLSTVLQPHGHASIPAPGQVMVSAPAQMQDSIRRAIIMLSQGEALGSKPKAQAAVDIWLVEALVVDGPADPRLAMAGEALDAARQRFGHRRYQLSERLMILTDLSGYPARTAGSMFRQAELRVVGQESGTIDGQVKLVISDNRSISNYESKLSLPDGQWQVVGLLSGSATTPEHLLLMRQTPVQPSSGS